MALSITDARKTQVDVRCSRHLSNVHHMLSKRLDSQILDREDFVVIGFAIYMLLSYAVCFYLIFGIPRAELVCGGHCRQYTQHYCACECTSSVSEGLSKFADPISTSR